MTITYPDGTVRQAILLKHEDDEIRAIDKGGVDILVFTRVHGVWISEAVEPVTIEFAWQRSKAAAVPCDADLVPDVLAAQLIEVLFRGDPEENDDYIANQSELEDLAKDLAGNPMLLPLWDTSPARVN